jgi:hypothetical protein
MGLRLQTDTNVFNRGRENRIYDSGEGSSGVVLAIGQWLRLGSDLVHRLPLLGCVLSFKGSTGVVEAAKLDRYAGTDSY